MPEEIYSGWHKSPAERGSEIKISFFLVASEDNQVCKCKLPVQIKNHFPLKTGEPPIECLTLTPNLKMQVLDYVVKGLDRVK